ncbi:hypothetical protein ACFL6U_27155 [Planctomycetota bacterium]
MFNARLSQRKSMRFAIYVVFILSMVFGVQTALSVTPQYYVLTVNTTGTGAVTLYPSGGAYAAGTLVVLVAEPGPGESFVGWFGDLGGVANPTFIYMDSHKSVAAAFSEQSPPSQNYTLAVNTVGSGSVTRNPTGSSYPAGTEVALVATPAAGWYFSGWSGSLSGSVNPATITMNGHKFVTATFKQYSTIFYTLTVNTVGSGNVILSPPGGFYAAGTVVQLIAQPAPGWYFQGWSGSISGSANPATITMNSFRHVTAIFSQWPSYDYTLTVNTAGSGAVTLSPPGGNYPAGMVVQMTAHPAPGWDFLGWFGDHTSGANPGAIKMDSNKDVMAVFVQQSSPYELEAIEVGDGTVTLNPPGGEYALGTMVEMSALPAPGWTFLGWSGDLTGDENPAYIGMSGHKTVYATFIQGQSQIGEPKASTYDPFWRIDGEKIYTYDANSVIFRGCVVEDGGQPCDARYVYWPDGGPEQATEWVHGFLNPDIYECFVEGLDPNTEYCYQLELRNSAGWVCDPYPRCFTTLSRLVIDSTPGGSVIEPSEGSHAHKSGTEINLIASAQSGYVFASWTGTAVDAGMVNDPLNPVTTVTVEGDLELTANFVIP